MTTFDISSDAKSVVLLDANRRGSASFVITNLSVQPRRVFLSVVPGNGAESGLFKLDQPAEQLIEPNRSLTATVHIAAERTARAGTQTLILKVADVDRPDVYFGESQPLQFVVPEILEDNRWKRWLLIAAAFVLLVLLAGGGWYLYRHPTVEDYHQADHPDRIDRAVAELNDAGMEVTKMVSAVVLEPARHGMVIMQMNGDAPADGAARLARGTPIKLEYAVLMPRLIGMGKDAAIEHLTALGLPSEMISVEALPTNSLADVGKIVEQRPDPGPPPTMGEGQLVLKHGVRRDPVIVPSFVGQPYCTAFRLLQSLGFVVSGQGDAILGPDAGKVTVQSIANTEAIPGDTIRLTYRGSIRPCRRAFLEEVSPGLHELRPGDGGSG